MAVNIPVIREVVENVCTRKDVLDACKRRKRTPTATSTFEAFADGLGMPPAAHRALGLDPEAAGSDLPTIGGKRSAGIAAVGQSDMPPVLSNLSTGSAMPVLLALRGIHQGYVEADRLMGSMCTTGPTQFQMPVVERASGAAERVRRKGWLPSEPTNLSEGLAYRSPLTD